MKAIVTGGAGFLGSHLCDKLLSLGYEVICIDNLLTSDGTNIDNLKNNSNFTFIQLNVINSLPENLKADEIYHLASPASPNHHSNKSYHALPFETMAVNTQGTWHLAEHAIKIGAKLLFASTSEAYGDPLEHPQKEEYRGNVSTTGPRSVYDEAKRFGETIVSSFIRSKGLDGRIIRIFNTYGSGMSLIDGRVVIQFIQQALKNEPITIFGDGKQTRSFCFVDDLIEGVVKVMQSEQSKGEIFNLGNPNEYTILELAQKVKELTNSNSEISSSEELPQDDPQKRCPDISKAKAILNWEPRTSLDEGLIKMIEYVKSLDN